MDSKRLKEINKELDRLNDQDRFEEAIALIETIPEEERDLEIKVYHANLLNNIAMITLGNFDEESEHYEQDEHDDETSPKIPYLKEAIHRLVAIQEEGKEDWYWNKRMANAYYSMGHVLINQSFHYYLLALPYFKKWYEVAEKKKKKEALKMVDECLENLADRYFAQGKYLDGFKIINEMSSKWDGYRPCFSVTGIKEEEEGDIDEALTKQLDELAEEGNHLLEQGDSKAALNVWQKAIDLIPEPKSEKPETIWFEASMGDIYFSQKAFNEANLLFDRAILNLSDEGKNPFILMRYGQCRYELGDYYWAKSHLLEVYKIEGEEIFRSEEQNLKYLDFLLEELKKDEEAKKKKKKNKASKTKFDENYIIVKDMVYDDYYPAFLVDKVKDEIQKVIDLLESGESDTEIIQEKLDEAVCKINDLQEEFYDNDSEIETVARDSIGVTIEYILNWFDVDIDIEEALRERDW